MELSELISLFTNNGIAIAICIYFLFKDYKFNSAITGTLGEIKEVLGMLKDLIINK